MADPATTTSAINSKDVSRASTPANAQVEKPPDDSSKFKTFISILRRFIGVSDLAAVRFSLPAQLLEPRPNLGMSASAPAPAPAPAPASVLVFAVQPV
jgi:hypothetical protein